MDSYGGLGMLRSTRGENSRNGERVRRTLQRCQEDIRHFLDTSSYQLIGVAREVSLTDAAYTNQKLQKELDDLKIMTDASRIHIECDEKYRLLEEELERIRRAAKIEQSTLESKVSILTTRNRELTETVMTFTQQKPVTSVIPAETQEELRHLREEVTRLSSRLSQQTEQYAVEKAIIVSSRDTLESKAAELESQLASTAKQRDEKSHRLATVEGELADASLKVQQLQAAAAAATSVIVPEEKNSEDSTSALFWKEQFDGAKARLVELEQSFSQVGQLKAEVAISQARLQAVDEEWKRCTALALGLPEDNTELGAHSIEEVLRKEVERRVKDATANSKSKSGTILASTLSGPNTVPADEDDGLLGLFGDLAPSVGTKVMTLGSNPHRQIAIRQHYETQLLRLKARNAQLETAMKTLMGEVEGEPQGGIQVGGDTEETTEEGQEDDPTQKAVGVARRLREIEQQLEKSRKLVDRLKTANLVTQRETAEVIARVLGWRVVRQDATAFWRFTPCTAKTDNVVPIHDNEDYFDVYSNEAPPLTDDVATLPAENDSSYQSAISKVLEVPKWMLDVNAAPGVTNGVQQDPEQSALLSLESLPAFFARFTYMRYFNANSFRIQQ